jgi:hypothetical protein
VTSPRAARITVGVATVLALAVVASELVSHESLAAALTRAGATAGLTMVLGTLGQRLWSGAVVSEAQLPRAGGLVFEKSAESLTRLEAELAELADAVEVRLVQLERLVLGSSGNGDGGNIP